MSIRFRRIYWVTEQLDDQGYSEVTGIYTSIPDLVEIGLATKPFCNKTAGLRITLCALDSQEAPLASFTSPTFGDVAEVLRPLVDNGELTAEEVAQLADALSEVARAERPR
ncbi:MAG: hypothetical protein K6T17_00665 [Fimbriimonadales bacterium]|nr:hypothetical protein [Fimbriimonadales bacterium]